VGIVQIQKGEEKAYFFVSIGLSVLAFWYLWHHFAGVEDKTVINVYDYWYVWIRPVIIGDCRDHYFAFGRAVSKRNFLDCVYSGGELGDFGHPGGSSLDSGRCPVGFGTGGPGAAQGIFGSGDHPCVVHHECHQEKIT
jgi:hypothetical protein